MTRRAGILCPIFSVPGNQGIGDLGQKTIRMIDAIADAGYQIWQILPLQMTGYSHSPYATLSSFAGDPIYINLDRLSEMGLLTQSSIINCNKFKDYVSYDEVRAFKEPYFQRAYKAFKKNFAQFKDEYETFLGEAFWLDDWTKFYLFKRMYDQRPWYEWEDEYRNFLDQESVDLSDYEDEMNYIRFLQFIFYKQWDEVHEYAKKKGISIMGDMPFYVDLDSADVWADREDFMISALGEPTYVAGCPPDYFSEDGQLWGMPVYDFEMQQKDGYKYWVSRMKWMERNYDLVRIDHFRAFDTYWRIPGGAKTAKEGEWILGPREALLHRILNKCPNLELVAEDLGMIRPEVLTLEQSFGIPGMDVLEFRMDAKQLKKSAKENSVLYTGTHDNATLEEEYATFDNNKRISLRRFFKKRGYNYRSFHDMVCHYALDSDADTVILPIWDVMGLKGNARINRPGTVEGNWTWKLKDFKVFPKELLKTKEWVENSGRAAQTEAE
jgi:4-alpha-glucanotransferase